MSTTINCYRSEKRKEERIEGEVGEEQGANKGRTEKTSTVAIGGVVQRRRKRKGRRRRRRRGRTSHVPAVSAMGLVRSSGGGGELRTTNFERQ